MNTNTPAGLNVLIRRIAVGDKEAQSELYILVNQPVFKYILNRFVPSIDEEDAKEITDQTIIEIYIHADQFKGLHDEASAWRWIYKIARNQTLKWLRTLKKTVSIWDTTNNDLTDDEYMLFDAIILFYSPISPEDTLEDQVLNKLIWESVRECISKLNKRDREIIKMRYMKNLTLEEIAQQYHIKRPRVHQILAAIHYKLRRAIKLDKL